VDLATSLAARGVRVTVAVLGPPPAADQQRQLAAVGVDCCSYPCRLEWMEDPWADIEAAGDWLLEVARSRRIDVVHLNGFCHAALDWPAPVIVTGHSCVLSWWRAVHAEDAPAHWRTYAERVRRGLHAANLITAPTAAMLKALQRYYGPLGDARVVANGRALPPGPPAPKEPFVLTAGRLWDEAKNVEAVCRAAPTLPWPVRVAGDTCSPDGEEIRRAGVEYLGRLPANDMTAWMRRASIYALPARYEPFGLSALEAALSGCALVLGDIDSLREVWGDAALFVPPHDDAALAAALRLLIRNERYRADMAARALARARAFTPERMAAAYLDAYTGLPASPPLAPQVVC
jgi:glycosyltransferase involved in cell wall biosynthesis